MARQGEVLRLNKYSRAALSSIFPLGGLSPLNDPAFQNAPAPRDVFALTIPKACFPSNAKTYGDIFAKANRNVNKTEAYVKLLGMISMAVTRPKNGFGALAQPHLDKRGQADISANLLSFTHNGRTYARTAQYMEELKCNNGGFCGMRLWVFVIDPQLDLSASLADVARTNELVYNPAANARPVTSSRAPLETVSRRDRYIAHARITSEAKIVTVMGMLVQGGAESIGPEYPQRSRATRSLRSALNSGLTIQGPDCPASLKTILSPALAVMVHTNDVCTLQRDLSGYCIVSDAGSDGLADGEAAATGDDDDDNGNSPHLTAEEMAELEEMAALEALNAGGRDAMDMDMDVDEAADDAAADIEDAAVSVLEGLARITFSGFPYPERVQAIPTDFFGEALLNVPLARCYADLEGDEGAADDAVADEVRPSLVLMFRLLEGNLEQWQSYPRDGPRIDYIRQMYNLHIVPHHDESSPLYFEFDARVLGGDRAAQEEAIYRIYLAALQRQDEWRTSDMIPEVRQKIQSVRPIILHLDATQTQRNADGRIEMVYNERERPLRETVSLEAMTKHDLEYFARVDDLLALRLDNHAAQNEICREYPPNSDEFYREIRQWRMAACERFWSVAMESDNVSPAWKKQREWFLRQPPNKQWARHELTHIDLTFYANTQLLQIERYNGIFNGASTQTLYLLMQRVVIGTPMYKWDLRPNLLIYGNGGDGKSYPLTPCEAMCVPGLVKCYTHVTEKAFSVNKPYSDETFAMHEAPGFMLGIDERGQEVSSNPILKDRLIRQRSGTMAFGTSESGERVRLEQEVMVMGNTILLTNDHIPSDKKALSQRFILMPVHHTKRKGFQKGDYANLGADEVAQMIRSDQVHASRLFSFYCSLVFQMCKAHVIPDPSTDGASKMLRQILHLFAERTKLDSEDGRKRTKVLDIMSITSVMNAVSVGLFSRLSDDYRQQERPDGSFEAVPFHPSMIVEHVMPRLYATDEVIMDTVNLMDFIFEPHVHYDILQSIVGQLNANVHRGEVVSKDTVQFRYMQNQRYRSRQHYAKHRRRHRTTALAHLNRRSIAGAPGGVVGHIQMRREDSDDDDDGAEEAEEPEFEIDPRYVTVTGSGITQIIAKIATAAKESQPSEVEVSRVLKMMAETQRECHPAYLVPVEGGQRGAYVEDDDDDDDSSSNEESERALEDGHASESESSYINPTPVGQRNLLGLRPPQSEQGRGRRVGKSQLDIYENKRFKLVIDESAPSTSEFVVIKGLDPRFRGGNHQYVAVMVEALQDDTFRNALLTATRDVLSCRNQPKEGKKYFTPNDYEHVFPNRTTEKMPQYKAIVKVEYRDTPLRFWHVPIGTEDSNAALANCTNDGGGTEAVLQAVRQNKLYTELGADEPINSHFLRSHLTACDLPLEDMEQYLPEWSDDEIYTRTMAIADANPARYVFVRNYPKSCADAEIVRRRVTDILKRDPDNVAGEAFRLESRTAAMLSYLAPAISEYAGVDIDPQTQQPIFATSVPANVREKVAALQRKFADSVDNVARFKEKHDQAERARIRAGNDTNRRRRQINARQMVAQSSADSFANFLLANEATMVERMPMSLPLTQSPSRHHHTHGENSQKAKKSKNPKNPKKSKKRPRPADESHPLHHKRARTHIVQ